MLEANYLKRSDGGNPSGVVEAGEIIQLTVRHNWWKPKWRWPSFHSRSACGVQGVGGFRPGAVILIAHQDRHLGAPETFAVGLGGEGLSLVGWGALFRCGTDLKGPTWAPAARGAKDIS